ncbi:3-hydroxyacyl-CoA dehydrogenase [Alkalihalobacillus sp. LMS6]|uniref:3-hydroxyacyl-CoA dehydrogenase n=1 Tax=Bacillaceae TaxID=186817 RepID=UPI000C07A0C9|nr:MULTISPECIES: 3-hydroxyacyl-CoA dehydrogenase [Bacillaceae]UTR06885.1 3-hydroxyacyl-CoA dehydrogenase [Alkalihalobacillus sp. LMS6]
MKFSNVMVAGSGVLGSQIAYQTAYKGFQVTVYDIHDEALDKAKERVEKLMTLYKQDFDLTDADVQQGYERMRFSANLSEAVQDADLVIEAVPEKLAIKKDFYTKLGEVAPDKTIFATNTSTLLPSQFAKETGRPEKFLALHFANDIRVKNTAEIMKHEGTDDHVFQALVEFAEAIGMVPLPIYKEQPGYILNSLLVPFLNAGQELLVNDIADAHTIDKTWMVATGSPAGPFAILDTVGIRTAYNISYAKGEAGDEAAQKVATFLKEEMIDKGKLGTESGEGFYKYPNPAYLEKDFLKA